MAPVAQSGLARTKDRALYEMRDYTAETFTPYVGQVLVFQRSPECGEASSPLELELLEVRRPAWGARPHGFREPFALLFAGVGGEPSASGLQRLAHRDFAACDWLLSRVVVPGGDPAVKYYEAVFG